MCVSGRVPEAIGRRRSFHSRPHVLLIRTHFGASRSQTLRGVALPQRGGSAGAVMVTAPREQDEGKENDASLLDKARHCFVERNIQNFGGGFMH